MIYDGLHHHQVTLTAQIFLALSLSIHPSWQVFQITSCVCTAGLNKFLPVNQYCHSYVSGPVKEHCLRVNPLFSSSVLYVFFILLGWLWRWEVSSHTYSCFVGFCFEDFFKISCCILVSFSSSFFSVHFVSVHVVQPYRSINTASVWKKSCLVLSDRSDFFQ